jgi:hypothetical protein
MLHWGSLEKFRRLEKENNEELKRRWKIPAHYKDEKTKINRLYCINVGEKKITNHTAQGV